MMKCESRQRWLVGLVAPLLTAVLMAGVASAQPPAAKPAAKPAPKPAEKAAATAKARKKPRGRLPAYYGKVVSEKQRKEIYVIQAKFNEQIVKLQQQLDQLSAQRDSDVTNVLTAEQRAEIEQLRGQRRSRRSASRASSSKSTAEKSTAEKTTKG